MKMKEYKPSDENFEGLIKIEQPNYIERQKIMEKIIEDLGPNNDMESNIFKIRTSWKMLEVAKNYIKYVDVKHKDGTEFKSYDELLDDPRCDMICTEISMNLVRGNQLGEPSERG